jgi:hypothetical protein
MLDEVDEFQVLLVLLAVAGVATVAFASFGLFMIFAGGSGGEAATIPAEFQCEAFDGDPDVGHETGYGIAQNTTLAKLYSLTANTTDSGFELRANVSDPSVLNVSAREADGTAVPVETVNGTVRVVRNDTASFRLWIDSADAGTITRSTLDICPPQDS